MHYKNSDWIDVQHCCSFYWKIRCSCAPLCEVQVTDDEAKVPFNGLIWNFVWDIWKKSNQPELNNSIQFCFNKDMYEPSLRMTMKEREKEYVTIYVGNQENIKTFFKSLFFTFFTSTIEP